MVRKRLTLELRRRFARLRGAIVKLLVHDDVFGLKRRIAGMRTMNAIPEREWQFRTSSEQVAAFQDWLRERYGQYLSVETLLRRYAEEGYRKGAGRAFDDVEKPYAAGYAADDSTRDFYSGSKEQFLKTAFGSPVGQERINQLAQRSFDDLSNVTDDMTARISRRLMDGLTQGQHPNEIAKGLSTDMDVSLGRAEMIARTEIIRAHAEGQLDAMESMGVAEVGVQVEWLTAMDDKVCFPEFTVIETDCGPRPIQDIRIGDMVKTRAGFRAVTALSCREYSGKMATVRADQFKVTSTADHPFWTVRGWIDASSLSVDDVVQSVDNKLLKVDSVVDFFLGQPAHIPSSGFKIPILSLVFGGISMPVGPIGFDGYSPKGDGKINSILANLGFLNESNADALECDANGFFNGRFRIGSSVASEGAESLFGISGTTAKFNFACVASDDRRRAAANLRAMIPEVSPLLIGSCLQEHLVARFALFVNSSLCCCSAGNGAIGVSVGNAFFNSECLGASDANLFDIPSARTFVALARAIGTIGNARRAIHGMPALLAFNGIAGFSGFEVTPTGAKSFGAFFLDCLRSPLKWFVALMADKIKWHGYQLLSDMNLLYHRMSGTPIKVYDFTVEGMHEYYANGILVHNCPKCEAMEGVILPIEKAHNLIPYHPGCRCAWTPAGEGIGLPPTENRIRNAFCPTGEGGGVDPTCSPGGGGGAGSLPSKGITPSQIADVVFRSPNNQLPPGKAIDEAKKRLIDHFGIQGTFQKTKESVGGLKDAIDSGKLQFVNPVTDQKTIDEKAASGKLNDVLIIRDKGGRFLVMDGSHSLHAAIKRGDKSINVIAPEKK